MPYSQTHTVGTLEVPKLNETDLSPEPTSPRHTPASRSHALLVQSSTVTITPFGGDNADCHPKPSTRWSPEFSMPILHDASLPLTPSELDAFCLSARIGRFHSGWSDILQSSVKTLVASWREEMYE